MQDQNIINALMDFTDLRKRKETPINETQQFQNQNDISSNEALIKSFKELREKLKLVNRQNITYKQNEKVQSIKLRQLQQILNITMKTDVELKDRVGQLNGQNNQLKRKVSAMKSSLQQKNQIEKELQYTKNMLVQVKLKCEDLINERHKIIQLSIEDKINLEQQVNRINLKNKSHMDYIQKLQFDYGRARQTILKLDNAIKKKQISFDEVVFGNNWAIDNFQTQHLQQCIKDLEKDNLILKNKNKKEEERRIHLEDRVIALEQQAGYCQMKAENLEGEIKVITGKLNKQNKKYTDLKEKLQTQKNQNLKMQQKLNAILVYSEQMINKLKKQNTGSRIQPILQFQSKIKTFTSCLNQQIISQVQTTIQPKIKQLPNCYNSVNYSTQPVILRDTTPKKILTQNNKINQTISNKKQMQSSRMTFGEENQYNDRNAIQNRVRKERQEMEKKLKEKRLYQKIQTTPTTQNYKLRGEYVSSFIERKY